jgi:hypothetical protein
MIDRRGYGLRLFRWLELSPTAMISTRQDSEGTRGPPSSWLLTVEVISTPALSGRSEQREVRAAGAPCSTKSAA